MGRLWRYAKLNDHHHDDDEQYKQQHRNSCNKEPDKVDNCKEFQEVCWHIIMWFFLCVLTWCLFVSYNNLVKPCTPDACSALSLCRFLFLSFSSVPLLWYENTFYDVRLQNLLSKGDCLFPIRILLRQVVCIVWQRIFVAQYTHSIWYS